MSLDNQNISLVKLTPLDKIKDRLTKTGVFVCEHKKWVVLVIGTTAGVILVVKKHTTIKELLQSFSKNKFITNPITNAITEVSVSSIPTDVLNHRTGKMLTATKLGDKVMVSNREINRRLINAGLAIRLPCGEYILTDIGKLFGKIHLKVTPWNKTVQQVQWDEIVLKIIFTPEELETLLHIKNI